MIQQIGERSIMHIFNLKKLYEQDKELSELYDNNDLKEFPFYFENKLKMLKSSSDEVALYAIYWYLELYVRIINNQFKTRVRIRVKELII